MCSGTGKREIQGWWLRTKSVTTAFRRCPSPSDQLKLTTSLLPMVSLPSQNHSLVSGRPVRFPDALSSIAS